MPDEQAPEAILSARERLWVTRWSKSVEARYRAVVEAQTATDRTAKDVAERLSR